MKLTIKREDLKRIHRVACSDWKTKIENFANRSPFDGEITFKESEIKAMLTACNQEQLPIVKEVFEVVDTFERIKTLEDAVIYLGESDEEVVTLRLLQSVVGLARHVIAEQELVVVIKALNEKHTFDWSNSNEYKYYNWFYLDGGKFRFYCSGYRDTDSCCSSRLCFKSNELSLYASKQFENLYKEYLKK